MRILIGDGPNLNLLGSREPEIYGRTTRTEIEASLRALSRHWKGLELECFQTNSEGAMIDWIHAQAPRAHGMVLNPGGWSHTSIALRDAVAAVGIPTIEVHLTQVQARESFRRRSVVAGACIGSIAGLGPYGYEAALIALCRRLGVAEIG